MEILELIILVIFASIVGILIAGGLVFFCFLKHLYQLHLRAEEVTKKLNEEEYQLFFFAKRLKFLMDLLDRCSSELTIKTRFDIPNKPYWLHEPPRMAILEAETIIEAVQLSQQKLTEMPPDTKKSA